MGKGGYTGGSTIIGPWSGWFSKPRPALTPQEQAAAKARRERRRAEELAARAAESTAKAARKAQKLAEQEASRKRREQIRANPALQRDPAEVAAKLNRHMQGVVVEVRRAGKVVTVRKPDGE